MLSQKALEILKYIRESKNGRAWNHCETEFLKERHWAKGTFVKYWKEVKPCLEKQPDTKRNGRFLYVVKKDFTTEPEKAALKQRVIRESAPLIPRDLVPSLLSAVGEVITENVYRNPLRAWDLIISISKTTPEPFKEKFNPYLSAARNFCDEELSFEWTHDRVLYRTRLRALVKNQVVPFLLDKFCSLLYET
jgi:hypothetical protein